MGTKPNSATHQAESLTLLRAAAPMIGTAGFRVSTAAPCSIRTIFRRHHWRAIPESLGSDCVSWAARFLRTRYFSLGPAERILESRDLNFIFNPNLPSSLIDFEAPFNKHSLTYYHARTRQTG